MSTTAKGPVVRRHLLPEACVPDGVVRVAVAMPLALLLSAVVALAWYCRNLLRDADAGHIVAVGDTPLVLFVGAFLVAGAAVVAVQSLRVANRVAGPEYRLRQALQRIRSGDVGFRISLRRGDLLTGLAAECNELLDWLNRNPPVGVRTGSDVVEVQPQRAVAGRPAPQEVGP